MHMADALISPVTGGAMWATSAAIGAYSIKKINKEDMFEGKKIPLMGIAGAFVFAAQMINFTIPGTGSSGHLGGGLLLAALLGPYAGFLVMSIVLTVQALFFTDGGLLALGCNIFNMGVIPCFVAYYLLYKPLALRGTNKKRVCAAAFTGSIAGLTAGALGVVLQTTVSGITELSFGLFSLFMMPIHLAIGAVEGLITAVVLLFIYRENPDFIYARYTDSEHSGRKRRRVAAILAAAAVFCGGLLCLFASSYPDGLEWSIFKVAGSEEVGYEGAVHKTAGDIQEKTGIMPDYNFKDARESAVGTSFAGLAGSALVLAAAGFSGFVIYLFKKRNANVADDTVES